jgi:SAM-dependent methyltransferase
VSGFSADWLALRAEADGRARDPELLRAAAEAAGAGPVLDLGAGTGATLAALGPLAAGARWILADLDAGLLDRAAERAQALGVEAETIACDLNADLERLAAREPALIAASAFFDLTSAAFVTRLAAAARTCGAAVYAALTYDGREVWTPPHGEDEAVAAAFLTDMARDKGFGPALGPAAGVALAEALRAAGYRVRTAPSPWRLTQPRDGALIAALAEGTASAAGASPAWLAARRKAESVEIGHLDLLATL